MAPTTRLMDNTKSKRAAHLAGNEDSKSKRQKQTVTASHIPATHSTLPNSKHPFLAPPSVLYIDSWLHNLSEPPSTMPKAVYENRHNSKSKKHASETLDSGNPKTIKRARKPSKKALEALEGNPGPRTPPVSTAELSSAGERSASLSEETKSSGRVKGPHFRKELLRHGVEIDLWGVHLPADVRALSDSILRKLRDSPEPADKEMAMFARTMRSLVNEDEAMIQHELMSNTPCFPKYQSYLTDTGEWAIKLNINILFKRAAVPHAPVGCIPLPLPKPDVIFGFTQDNFSQAAQEAATLPSLKEYAAPARSPENLFPFLITEFKSSNGGSFWVADNQNAITGACCVTGIEKLLSLAYPTVKRCSSTDSMAFSCVVDSCLARIWVHWYRKEYVAGDIGPGPYLSAKLRTYDLVEPKQAIAFRVALRNIMDWGLGDRLTAVREALLKVAGSVAIDG